MRDWKMTERLARRIIETLEFIRGLDDELTAVLNLDNATLEECKQMVELVDIGPCIYNEWFLTGFRVQRRIRELEEVNDVPS